MMYQSSIRCMIHQGRELLRSLDAVAVRYQLSDLIPVQVVLDNHAHHPGAPPRLEERMAGVDKRVELWVFRPEDQDPFVRLAVVDGENLAEVILADQPAPTV